MDVQKIKSLINWWNKTDTQGMDINEYLFNPLMEAFGEDVNEIISYLNKMKLDDLHTVSGVFENIYEKFTTEDVYDSLEQLEKKIK